jgi:hypothetical protein
MLQESTDIWFCSFLMYKGHHIVKFDKLLRGRVKCYFNLTAEEWSTLKLEFNNSEFIKFKAFTEQIKDLGY